MRGISSVMERFEELSISQRELLSQVEEEASSWRNAYDAREHELSELRKELAQLKISKVESNAATPLLLCLIDGDGCIFNESLLAQGSEGGRAAASKLRYHIMQHYIEDMANHSGNPDILVHVFFNREGLGKTIKTCLGVQPGTFNAFINGFNTASPLMSMLDVGTGKEAADAKIREHMRIFVRYPNVKKIYFGGGHDNGYCNNLTTLQNEGYLRKIVLLQGYSQLAAEIKALELPCLENNGIFLSTKLSAKSLAVSSSASPAPATNRTKSTNKSPVPPPAVPVPPKSQPTQIPIGKSAKANIAFLKSLQPRACNDHYLTRRGCKTVNCPYGHDYDMPDKVLADFRDYVKQNPCLLKNKGQPCDTVECPSAHQCPQGPNCTWNKQGNCKFVASGMHGTILSSEEDDDRVLVGSTIATLRTHNRTGSSSSSMVDFPDYPTGTSPTKQPITPKRPNASSNRTQVKNAFKSSVSGSTTKERLQQMGVGSGGKFDDDDDDSDSSEQPLGRAQHFLRPGVISFVSASEPTGPSGFAGLTMNRHTPNPRVF